MTELPGHHLTKDGSSTFYSKTFQQFYHNPNGAVAESIHVFFETSGLLDRLKTHPQQVSVFEMGFGTGLNLLLLADFCAFYSPQTQIDFFSVEAFPLSSDEASEINYDDFLTSIDTENVLPDIFKSLTSGFNTLQPFPELNLKLTLFYGMYEDMAFQNHYSFDYFFHDPFSPEVNESLWMPDTFENLIHSAKTEAKLATYSAASKARAAMAKAGWKVARAPGALGKREMTIASPSEIALNGLKRVNESRLIERWNSGDFK